MVSLEPTTGAVRWAHNADPHGLFDHDFQNTPVLVTLPIDGVPTELAIGSGKTGTLLAIKESAGDIVWQTAVGLHRNDDLAALPPGEEIEVAPGAWGGVVSPIAFADGLLYVPVVDFPTRYTSTGYDQASMFDFAQAQGELLAIDAATGRVGWTTKLPTSPFAGATVVDDVVFTAGLDGQFRAFDTATGREVWTYQASAGINAPPAVAGEMVFVPAAGPRIFGNTPDSDEVRPEIVNEVIAFRLPNHAGTPAPAS